MRDLTEVTNKGRSLTSFSIEITLPTFPFRTGPSDSVDGFQLAWQAPELNFSALVEPWGFKANNLGWPMPPLLRTWPERAKTALIYRWYTPVGLNMAMSEFSAFGKFQALLQGRPPSQWRKREGGSGEGGGGKTPGLGSSAIRHRRQGGGGRVLRNPAVVGQCWRREWGRLVSGTAL